MRRRNFSEVYFSGEDIELPPCVGSLKKKGTPFLWVTPSLGLWQQRLGRVNTDRQGVEYTGHCSSVGVFFFHRLIHGIAIVSSVIPPRIQVLQDGFCSATITIGRVPGARGELRPRIHPLCPLSSSLPQQARMVSSVFDLTGLHLDCGHDQTYPNCSVFYRLAARWRQGS